MASDHIKLEIEPRQTRTPIGHGGQGIDTIELVGNLLRIDGWYDTDDTTASFAAAVHLTDTQLKALRGLPMANEPVQPTRPPQHR